MSKLFINATLVLPDRLLPNGWLLEENGKILRYGNGEAPEAEETVETEETEEGEEAPEAEDAVGE